MGGLFKLSASFWMKEKYILIIVIVDDNEVGPISAY